MRRRGSLQSAGGACGAALAGAALRPAVGRLAAGGVQALHVPPGEPLMGDDGEATVDGSHPTGLGFRVACPLDGR